MGKLEQCHYGGSRLDFLGFWESFTTTRPSLSGWNKDPAVLLGGSRGQSKNFDNQDINVDSIYILGVIHLHLLRLRDRLWEEIFRYSYMSCNLKSITAKLFWVSICML